MVMRTEEFIATVQEHGCLWNRSDKFYGNMKAKLNAWKLISESSNIPIDQCEKKWRSLREQFAKSIAKEKMFEEVYADYRNFSWKYTSQLEFLREHIIPRPSTRNDDENDTPTVCQAINTAGTDETAQIQSPPNEVENPISSYTVELTNIDKVIQTAANQEENSISSYTNEAINAEDTDGTAQIQMPPNVHVEVFNIEVIKRPVNEEENYEYLPDEAVNVEGTDGTAQIQMPTNETPGIEEETSLPIYMDKSTNTDIYTETVTVETQTIREDTEQPSCSMEKNVKRTSGIRETFKKPYLSKQSDEEDENFSHIITAKLKKMPNSFKNEVKLSMLSYNYKFEMFIDETNTSENNTNT